ncbi:MAG: hypothetical protein EU981_04750 [Candidatus Liberibacter ctenarytainae]|uniref:Tyrosine specific protein phosphatases domain-containing protein n=1 Tax=Candidatus Liberibacter ctenarytainae TaxID=2020335 RepID=A0A937AD85_9HYPH|nr:hypothetical protein [Candidatus Liberibacter ctenarytainae]
MKFRTFIKRASIVTLIFIPVLVGMFCFIVTSCTPNFYVVSPNTVYRSAQPNSIFIQYLSKNHGIKSIINLRGENNASWYREEEQTARALGIKLINFPISVEKGLNEEQIKKLITLLKTADKPLLIHCKAGADRTGLASALYLYFIAHGQKEQASGQLSILYGHLPFKARSMDLAFNKSKEISFNYIPETNKKSMLPNP